MPALNPPPTTGTGRPRRLGRVRELLPGSSGEIAVDSMWTLANELVLLITITASFAMLGRELGPERYGQYVGLFAIVVPLAAAGYAAVLAVMQYSFRENVEPSRALAIFLSVAGVVGLASIAIAVPIAVLVLPDLSLAAILAVAIVELFIVPATRVMAAAVRAVRGVPAAIRLELSATVVRFGVLFSLFLVDDLTIRSLAIGWLLALSILVTVIVLVWMPRAGVRVSLRRPTPRDFGVAGALGAPIFAANFQANGDKVVLNGAGLERDAGLYGAAFRVVTLALTPLSALDLAVFHRFLPAGDDSTPGLHVRRSLRYTAVSMVVILPTAVAVFFLAPLFEIVVGSEFGSSVEMIRWLLLWLPIKAISGPPLNGLLGLGRLGLRLAVVTGTALLSATLYIVLIPDHGWVGALIGTIIAEAVLAAAGWQALFSAQRRHDELNSRPTQRPQDAAEDRSRNSSR